MALSNLAGWNKNQTASACGSSCGASDKKVVACGSSCGADDKKVAVACGSSCGADDK